MKLEEIGFYTLSDKRAEQTSGTSPMWRCEMLLTPKCNFKCPYCRGFQNLAVPCGEMDLEDARCTLDVWISQGLKNIRFSGGEPTLYPHLKELVERCRYAGVERIALSTNGSQPLELYEELVGAGVNDLSVSLDACCASFGDVMSGTKGDWDIVTANIQALSRICYVTVGVVVTPETVEQVPAVVKFAHHLGVADIRLISAAQWDELLEPAKQIPQEILDAHPILKYRVQNIRSSRNVRGITPGDSPKCSLVKDDSVVIGSYHFPCIIYAREGGEPIGRISENMREERMKWFESHDSYADPICRKNCLDICIDYNNKASKDD